MMKIPTDNDKIFVSLIKDLPISIKIFLRVKKIFEKAFITTLI